MWDLAVSSLGMLLSPGALVRWAGLAVLEFKGLSYAGPNRMNISYHITRLGHLFHNSSQSLVMNTK